MDSTPFTFWQTVTLILSGLTVLIYSLWLARYVRNKNEPECRNCRDCRCHAPAETPKTNTPLRPRTKGTARINDRA
jgi:hypothetical protein